MSYIKIFSFTGLTPREGRPHSETRLEQIERSINSDLEKEGQEAEVVFLLKHEDWANAQEFMTTVTIMAVFPSKKKSKGKESPKLSQPPKKKK